MANLNQPQDPIAKNKPRVRVFQNLATERLILRQTTPADAADFFDLYNDTEVIRYHNFGPFENLAKIEERVLRPANYLFDTGKGYHWGITLRDSDKIIGSCVFYSIEWTNFSTKLGFDLARPYWGKGIMSEALSAILHWVIQRRRINRVQAETDPDNKRSIATLRRLGFLRRGIIKAVRTLAWSIS